MQGNMLPQRQAGLFIGMGLDQRKHEQKKSLRLATHFAVLSWLIFFPYAHAAPNGGQIVGGSGSINTQSLAINWSSFDVNHNETVNFLQPNASSIALNRILGNNASQIFGQINSSV